MELIASHVGTEGAASLRLASKEWNQAVAATLLKCAPSRAIKDEEFGLICAFFPNITSLNLDCCRSLTDAAMVSLAKLPNLVDVNLTCCSGLIGEESSNALENMSTLKTLNLMFSENLKGLGCFLALPSLEYLNLDICQALTSESLLSIPKFSGLKELHISHRITAPALAGLGKLTNLERLFLCDGCIGESTNYSELLVLVISQLPKLVYLDISDSYLGAATIRLFCNYPRDMVIILDDVQSFDALDLEICLVMLSPQSPFGAQLLAMEALGSVAVGQEDVFLQAGGLSAVVKIMWDCERLQFAAFEAMSELAFRSSAFQNAFLELGLVPRICALLTVEDDGSDGCVSLAAGIFLFCSVVLGARVW